MKKECLIVVDVQNDFVEGGALAVNGGKSIVEGINKILPQFEHVVFTQDWHPQDHVSFASNHPGHSLYETVETPAGQQILWPDHCVQNTRGGDFVDGLKTEGGFIQRKGSNPKLDSYSGFVEADGKTETGLREHLKNKGITKVWICGLATDFCVSWTALDAKRMGFDVTVVEDLCRGIDLNGSVEAEKKKWKDAGIKTTNSENL